MLPMLLNAHQEKRMRTIIGGLLVAVALILTPLSHATTFSADQSDLWGDNDSGWGIQFVQQGDTIFATMFHYDTDNKPTWFIATLKPSDQTHWTGRIFRTTGPYFGGAWDANRLSLTDVGSMAWYSGNLQQGTLNYTINGQTVTRSLERALFAHNKVAGSYDVTAKFSAAGGGCASGVAGLQSAKLTISNDAAFKLGSVTFQSTGGRRCSVTNASISETGQFFNLQGPYTCDDGEQGTMLLAEVKTTYDGTIMGLVALYNQAETCQVGGGFGGVVD